MERKEMQLLETGLGNVTWWGYSPSFNILDDVTIPGFAIDGKKGNKPENPFQSYDLTKQN